MKKKLNRESKESLPDEHPVDYVVGQVSGSLFPKDSGSGSLSSLFSTAPAAAPLVFVPAPKPVQKNTEVKEEKDKGPHIHSQRKAPKERSEADQKLEKRESALHNADEAERGRAAPKKTKRRAVDPDEGPGGGEEEWGAKKRRRTAASMVEERIKQKRTVFVGNLPTSCTKKTLQILFRDKGAIESIRFRSVVREDPTMSRKVAAIQRKVHPKKNSINAYVVFKDEDGVSKALERNGMEIEKNFHIRVDRVSQKSSHDHKRSVFVGNLAFDISELAFRQHFEECGTVEAVRLVRDKDSGMGKGFGYVLFESADSVQLALKLCGSRLEGRSVRVKRSVKKEKEKKKGAPDRGPGTKASRGPRKGPAGAEEGSKGAKQTGREKGPAKKGRFSGTPGRKFTGNPTKTKSPGKSPSKSSSSFKGEMADPTKKAKKNKGLKKKHKAGKHVHI